MKIGVIGFGSIGQRHCRNLINRGVANLGLLRHRAQGNDLDLPEYTNEEEFWNMQWDSVLITNRTSDHYETLLKARDKVKSIFIEKPICCTRKQLDNLRRAFKGKEDTVMIGMNLRYHPLVKKAKQVIEKGSIGKIYSSRFFVGQYLPDWRPQTDYRSSYSARKELGGGVVFDLIHELDLSVYLSGPPINEVHSIIDRLSDLEIEVEDTAEIIFKSSQNIMVSIHMDYLRRGYERVFSLYGSKGSFRGDLQSNSWEIFGENGELINSDYSTSYDQNQMYDSEITDFIQKGASLEAFKPNLKDGLDAVALALKILGDESE